MRLPIPGSNTYLPAAKEEAEVGMVNTISFIQANLQHNTAASRDISRTVCAQIIDVALIQEPWYREGCVRDLNIPGYILFFAGGTGRPRACILTRNETAWLLPGFSCRGLVAVLIQYNEEGTERSLVVCSVYLSYDSDYPSPSKELENSWDTVKMNTSHWW
jgi:hypothetical protein